MLALVCSCLVVVAVALFPQSGVLSGAPLLPGNHVIPSLEISS